MKSSLWPWTILFQKESRNRPDNVRCDLTVAYFCFPPFKCLSPSHSSNYSYFSGPFNCRYTSRISGFIVVSPCWGYGFVTQTWLSDDAKEKLCRSNVTFISDRSTTAWLEARWHRVETLTSGLNPPGRGLSQFWCNSGGYSGTLRLLYMFPSAPCAFLGVGFLGIKAPSSPLCSMIRGLVTYCYCRHDKTPPHMASFGEIWLRRLGS
jgi:hypothetical protein